MPFNSDNSAVAEWLIRTYVGPHYVNAFYGGTVFMYGGLPPTSPWSTNKFNESYLCSTALQFLEQDFRSNHFYLCLHPENADVKRTEWFQKPLKRNNIHPFTTHEITGELACENVVKACKENHSDLLTIFADPIHMPLIMAEVVALLKREGLFDPSAGKVDLRVYIKTVSGCNWSLRDGFKLSGCSDWLSFVSSVAERFSSQVASPAEVIEYYNMRDVATEQIKHLIQVCCD